MGLRYVDPARPTTKVARALNSFGRSRAGQWVGKHVVTRTDVALSRMSSGRLNWGMFNVPTATLETIGAKSGQPRLVQLAYFHDGDDVIVVASNFGGEKHPGWYYNLVAQPACTFGGEAFIAREVTDDTGYTRLYGLAEQHYGGFTDYRIKTRRIGRAIPLFRLSPASSER